MQFQINITCTPEEARQFFGVPDLAPMQQAFFEQMNGKLAENMQSMDAESFMKNWMPVMFQGWADSQKNLMKQMQTMGNVNIKTGADSKTDAKHK